MKIITIKRPIKYIRLLQKVQSILTGLHGIDIITLGTSTVGYVQDFDTDSFGRFQLVLNTASKNAFYVWIASHPMPAFV